MNNIAFTGFKNVGGMVTPKNFEVGNKYNHICLELTNKNGKDLDEFQPVLKRFSNPINKNFINFSIQKYKNKTEFELNGKSLHVEDDNLPIFSKIAKLMTKIKNSAEQFEVNKDYLDGDDCKKFYDIEREAFGEDIVKQMHNEKTVKLCATNISNSIGEEMLNYLS